MNQQICCSSGACDAPQPTSSIGMCPHSGSKGKRVDGATIKAMLSVSLTEVQETPYFFCKDVSCPVVYFSEDGTQTFTIDQIRERVYQKEPDSDDVLMCYCFCHTPRSIRTELINTGESTVIEAINAGIQAGHCACDILNPQGACCLGNVSAFVKAIRAIGTGPYAAMSIKNRDVTTIGVAEITEILKARHSTPTRASMMFSRHILQLLSEGQPVTPEQLAEATDQPIELIRTTFTAIRNSGCEFNEEGALIGSALTLTPTRHQFRVKGRDLYAWCALDTLFLPALIDETAEVISNCPQTGTPISLTVSPTGLEAVNPPETALSIVISSGCTSGLNGTFCGQIHFFASREAASEWVAGRTELAVLGINDAFEVARQVYVQPVS